MWVYRLRLSIKNGIFITIILTEDEGVNGW